ncbi:MAG: glycosyltransferase family 4 protein [Candidatus Daviesbacteria bacterium]|nr:glycosyltransferase family 4 protein [Candidatus Daviesbacteria bacterium]
MKILLINDSYEGIGGEKVYINSLSRELKNLGHKVFKLYLSEEHHIENKDPIVLNNKFQNKLQWFFSQNLINLKLYYKIRNYILKVEPDIIHLNNINKASKTILLACIGYKKIMTVHDFGFLCPLCNYKNKNYYFVCDGKHSRSFKCFKNSDFKLQTYLVDFLLFNDILIKKLLIKFFICPSKELYKSLINAGFTNAIYLPYFTNFKPKMITKKSDTILYVGRLHAQKGVKYLLKVLRLVLDKNKKIKLSIVGRGPEEENLRYLAKKLKIEKNIKFLGEINNNKISKYFKYSFCLASPSLWKETGPIVVYEAMSFGKPIIVSDNAGVKDHIIDGQNGFLVNRFDFNKIAEKIILLHTNKTLARKMGEINLKIVKDKLGPKSHIKKILKIYNTIIQNKKLYL